MSEKHRMEKVITPYLHEEEQKRLTKLYGSNQGLCPYIRNPSVTRDDSVSGLCALANCSPCEGSLPQNSYQCPVRKKKLPGAFERD